MFVSRIVCFPPILPRYIGDTVSYALFGGISDNDETETKPNIEVIILYEKRVLFWDFIILLYTYDEVFIIVHMTLQCNIMKFICTYLSYRYIPINVAVNRELTVFAVYNIGITYNDLYKCGRPTAYSIFDNTPTSMTCYIYIYTE